jgi:hypothetical protein
MNHEKIWLNRLRAKSPSQLPDLPVTDQWIASTSTFCFQNIPGDTSDLSRAQGSTQLDARNTVQPPQKLPAKIPEKNLIPDFRF